MLLRRPIVSKWSARAIVFTLLVINIGIFTALGSQSKTHAALFFVMLVSYYILRKGAGDYTPALHKTGVASVKPLPEVWPRLLIASPPVIVKERTRAENLPSF